MKNLLTSLCLLTVFLFVWSCEQPAPPAEAPEGEAMTEMEVAKNPINPPICRKIGGYEVDSTCAHSAMDAWDQAVANIKATSSSSDTEYLIRGFAMHHAEIDSMQAELQNDSLVYAMLAIERVDLGNGQFENQTKIIFMGSSNTNPNMYRYFNFTVPCPNTCPKN